MSKQEQSRDGKHLKSQVLRTTGRKQTDDLKSLDLPAYSLPTIYLLRGHLLMTKSIADIQ